MSECVGGMDVFDGSHSSADTSVHICFAVKEVRRQSNVGVMVCIGNAVCGCACEELLQLM